ncbi:kinase-like domain-containing protein [Hyaloraphidium curvatum]|nr:kinase-like domain-containing protein [Hyaloraphidium curvatum]
MSFPESPLQLRTNLLPPPPPGETAYSDCEQHFLVRAVQNGAEAQKRIRRPYPKYAVRTLETRRADQVIEFDRFWRIDAELGVGSFGAVYRVHVFSTGHSYAIKILRKHDFGTMRNVQQLLREIGILGSVSHPNIVRLYELLETRDLFIMVQEDCRGGELLARLAAMPSFPEDNARHILRALLSAIVYLHERHIVHRDLKLENVLLADEPRGPDDWARQLRIADFGLANFADSDNRNLLKTRCGTFHYMPPEIIRGRTYGSAVDMWSVGVILFILLSGSYPFDADDAPTIMNNIKRGKWEFPEPEWVSPEALDLLGKLMVVDPEWVVAGRVRVAGELTSGRAGSG